MKLPPELSAAIEELDALRAQRDDAWQIPRIEGELLYQIAVSAQAKTIVEVGTSYGFSGLFWAAALRHTGGTLHTIDLDPKKVTESRRIFDRAGVGRSVINHQGDLREILPKLGVTADVLFLDAGEKRLTLDYFNLAWPLVRVGGSLLTDNTTTHPAELKPFIQHMRSRPDAVSAELPVGNGLEWTLKLS